MSEWKNYRLKDLFCIYSGATPSSKIEEYWDGDIKWVTPADMSDFGYISNCANTITQVGYDSCGTTLVPVDSIIISSRAPIGKINITKSPMCTNQGCKSLVPQKNNVNSKFVAYYLYNNVKDIDSLGQGTTFKELPTKRLIPYSIMMPSYIEQQRIVDYLDKKLATIDHRVEVLEKEKDAYSRLKNSVINQALTRGLKPNVDLKDSGIDWIGVIPRHWEIKRGKDFLKIVNGFPADSNLFSIDGSGLPLVRIRDISNLKTEVNYIGEVPSWALLKDNDLLIGMDGDFNVCFWNGGAAILNQRVCKISSKIADIHYICYSIAPKLKELNAKTNSTTVKHLSSYDIQNLYFAFPPLSEQQAIADYLDEKCAKIDAAIENISKQIDASKRLKKAIINEAISGKLFD